MHYTLNNVVSFIWENKGEACKLWAWRDLAGHVVSKSHENRLLVLHDDQGICGATTYSLDTENKRIHIHLIVATRDGFNYFRKHVREHYPNWTIVGERPNRGLVTYPKLTESK